RAITGFDVSRHRCQIMAALSTVPVPLSRIDDPDYARLGPLEQLTLWCAEQALRDAGWWGRHDDTRLGIVLGLGGEWLRRWELDRAAGGQRVDDPRPDQDSLLQVVRHELGLNGPAVTAAAA